jgi:amino acid adenylation domain-containing protein
MADWATINDVFAGHARRQPEALAVEAGGERRSYAELAARVDLFAGCLAARLDGHGAEPLVGVCLARDVDLPAWLLAILKVGAAYLPIDPTMPPIRFGHVIEDAAPALIVASRCHLGVVAAAATPILIAEEAAAVPAGPPPMAAIGPSTLAYVIFTSGSTGRPKGVEIEHGSLVALMSAMATKPGLSAGERMLGLTRISFDLSVPDLFLPFFVGASLALVDLDVAADPERLALAFDAYRPDLAQATPSTWRTLIEAGWDGSRSLRIVAGGEAVTRAFADRMLPRCAALWNIYGPTETTVWATACRVRAGDGAVPIGWPMDGVRVHVADETGASDPLDAVGEIVIGGGGVARGYRGRSDLTAQRFVTLADGSRAYRTGDLGRFDRDGALYCLGRLDDQVKVRGFRIELGDVEAALALHPAVGWSAARVWTDPAGEVMLAGYIVARAGATLEVARLRAFLADHLAPYMIPDRLIAIAAMPLTPNGKVDRAALPDPIVPVVASVDRNTGVQPRLAALWSELLGVSVVGADDDFFELGGYSLMTVRLARRIEADFGVKLALIDLMRHSTLAAMARRIEEGSGEAAPAVMLLNQPGGRPPLFWLDAGPLMRTIMRGLSADQPAFGLNIDAADEEALGSGALSIGAIAARLHARLVATQPAGPYYLGGWCRWGIVAFELARRLSDAGETVGLLVLLDAERPGWRRQRPGLRSRITRWLRRPGGRTSPEEPSFSQRVETASRSYRAQRYQGDMLLFRPEANEDGGGWEPIIGGSLLVEGIPGDHLAMVRGASAQVLAAKLDAALLDAQLTTAHPLPPIRQAARVTGC